MLYGVHQDIPTQRAKIGYIWFSPEKELQRDPGTVFCIHSSEITKEVSGKLVEEIS